MALMVLGATLIPATFAGKAVAATTPQGALQFMTALSARVTGVLNARDNSAVDRDRAIRRLLAENFDLPLIGRYVIGGAWQIATPAQRREFQSLFSDWVLRTYTHELSAHRGNVIRIMKASPAGKQDVLVTSKYYRTRLIPVVAAWRVRAIGGAHKILDVMVNGSSLVMTKRSEFQGVVRKRGVDGLLRLLRAKVAKLEAAAS